VVASKGAFVSSSVASVMQPDNIITTNSKPHDLIVFIIYPLVIFHVAILLTQCNKPYSLLLLGETIGEDSSMSPPRMSFYRINTAIETGLRREEQFRLRWGRQQADE